MRNISGRFSCLNALRALCVGFFVYLFSVSAGASDFEIVDKSDSIRIETNSYATERHTQIVKILTEKGTAYREYLAVNSYIEIKNIEVTVRNSTGTSSKLRKDQIYEVPIVESADMVTDYKAIVIAPESLRPNDTVHLQYDRAITSLLYIDPWTYATNVPVRKSKCTITYPATLSLRYRGQDSEIKIEQKESAGWKTLQMEARARDPVLLTGKSESFNSVEKKVIFLPEQTFTDKWLLSTRTWQDVAQWYSELTKFAYREDPAMDQVVNTVKANATTPEQIAEGLYQYVQKHFTYMAIEIGIGGYKPRSASHTFQKKYGDCKDLTFLYLVLLKKAGIEAYPALVDTRHAKFFYSDFPTPSQFNHSIAYLPRIKNGIWVDTTVKNYQLGEVPAVIQGKRALVAGGPNTLLVIPADFHNANVLKFQIEGHLTERALNMSGAVHTLGQANAYTELMKNALMRNAVKAYVYNSLLKSGLPLQKLQTKKAGERTIELEFSTPVTSLEPYKMLLLNPVRYSAVDAAASEPRHNEYFALGLPIRLVFDSIVHLNGRLLAMSPLQAEKKGEYVTYQLYIKEEQGKLHYLADAYFANGFLDAEEMKKYTKEIREFAAQLQRTVLIR